MGIFNRLGRGLSEDDFDAEFDDHPLPPARAELPPINYAQPQYRQPAPPPRPPEPEITSEDLGRITADVIKAAHEEAATALEALGKEIQQRMVQIETLKMQAIQQIIDCKDLAEQHRERGKHMSTQVEMAAMDLGEAKDLIDSMRNKIRM